MYEKENIEWKSTWKDDYLKWICGFANANGGKVYIGKDDLGKPVRLSNVKKLLEDIPNKIINHLGIFCDVNLIVESNIQLIEIVVPSYEIPTSFHGKYYYRSGSTMQELRGNVLNDFLLRRTGKSWDDVIEPETSIANINPETFEYFKKYAIQNKRLPGIENEGDLTKALQNLKLAKNDKLKRAAILLFGTDPRDYFFNAYAKIGKFGQNDEELLSQNVIEGNAFQLADKLIDFLETKYLTKKISYNGIHRIETLEYPFEALREAIINAIIHKDYTGPFIQISVFEDKLMIWNPGSLPDEITIEDLKKPHSSYPRNPKLADIFFKGGLIEAWGRGTLRIINSCKEMGLPHPDFKILNGGFCITFYKNIYSEENLSKLKLSDIQQKIILFTKEKGRVSNSDIQRLLNVSKMTAYRYLSDLEGKFLSKKGKTGKGTYYVLK